MKAIVKVVHRAGQFEAALDAVTPDSVRVVDGALVVTDWDSHTTYLFAPTFWHRGEVVTRD